MVRLSDDLASLYRTVEIAGDEGVDVEVAELVAQRLGLADAGGIEFALGLPLHDLAGIVDGFAVAYKI